MNFSRRQMLSAMLSASVGAMQWARAGAGPSRSLIVTASREGPHAAAIDGMQAALAAHSIPATIYRLPNDEPALRDAINGAGSAQVPIIAVGIEAVRVLAPEMGRVPVTATMVFRDDVAKLKGSLGAAPRLAGAVYLDLPVSRIAGGVKDVFPEATRFAVICNREQANAADGSNAGRAVPNVQMKQVICISAPELLDALRKLRGQVEFVICQPDGNLYNKTTAEPLILASLEHKLPLIGFSASFVRAGAALGVYPDFAEVGRQTAAMCEWGTGSAAGIREEHPRKTTVAVNERVLHLIGRDYKLKAGGDVVVVR